MAMQMNSRKRALDKIYKRRDRYEIPDWQREEVWDTNKKQELIDSILRGWKLPKFYLVKTADDPEEFEVVDGQQRLAAIFEFFDNALPLSAKAAKQFKGRLYKDLPQAHSDAFDDFEIEYDEIADASEQELKDFFQRLQQGLPLTSSEKLNAVHSELRNFCRGIAKHDFFKRSVAFANKRYAFFDVASKATATEIEGLEAGLRFDDLKQLFESQASFSPQSAVAKRINKTLDFLAKAFSSRTAELRNRSIVQSIIIVASRFVSTGKAAGHESEFAEFVEKFVEELSKQVELGLSATDADYIAFQRSVNANVRGGAKTRHQILLRKMFRIAPSLAAVFDPTTVAEAGVNSEIRRIGDSLSGLVEQINDTYSAKHGTDLFKATNKTVGAQKLLAKPIKSYSDYKALMENMYFLFWEAPGNRLDPSPPQSLKDINALRTDLQHDVDHGKQSKVAKKRKRISATFKKYASASTPRTIDPDEFAIVQLNILAAIEIDLKNLLATL